jgi:hypothetical protein
MTSDPSSQTQNYSYSNQTVSSVQSDPVIELGKKLVHELGLDHSVDTLSRWMAHYIAELIHLAENAETEDSAEKKSKCAEAILSLWRYRSELPNGKRPFEDLEPLLKTLENLDPDKHIPRYFTSVRKAAEVEELKGETKKWLSLAEEIDYSAKILIRYCLGRAAEKALDKAKEWVILAEVLKSEEMRERSLIQFLIFEEDELNSAQVDEKANIIIKERLEHLKSFIKTSQILSDELSSRVKETSRSKEKAKKGRKRK